MSWAIGYDSHWNRDIGYGVPAVCDHPRCNTQIDRGLAYVCGSEPYGGEHGCGLYFCDLHRSYWRQGSAVCAKCVRYRAPYKAKPDTLIWVIWKLEDESWAQWRAQHPSDVEEMQKRVKDASQSELKAAREFIREYA